jgi:hypothetical protein
VHGAKRRNGIPEGGPLTYLKYACGDFHPSALLDEAPRNPRDEQLHRTLAERGCYLPPSFSLESSPYANIFICVCGSANMAFKIIAPMREGEIGTKNRTTPKTVPRDELWRNGVLG